MISLAGLAGRNQSLITVTMKSMVLTGKNQTGLHRYAAAAEIKAMPALKIAT